VTGRKEGTGLGLTISKGAVEAHGGTITLVPTSAGSCFQVRLPVGKA
jgi:signal transduction histidine kinase